MAPPATLKRIVLENYRSCLRTSIDLDPRLSVFIGPNGSGKTNILLGLMLLNQMSHWPEHAPGLRRLTTTSRLRAAFRVGSSEAELRASVKAYTNESNSDVMVTSSQKWALSRGRRRFSSELPLTTAGHLRSIGRHHFVPAEFARHQYQLFIGSSHRARPVPRWAGSTFAGVERFCRGMRYYGASQFTNPGSCPTSFEVEREGGIRGLHRTRGHARILYGMYSANRDGSSEYREFLEIVGRKGLRLIDGLTFHEVRSSSTEYSVRVGGKVERRRRENLLVVPQFKIGTQTLSPNQLSEGTFKTLALLFHLITEKSTALLIEEPEVCIHHGLLASILELVKLYSLQKQIILSTHSDYVLDHVKPDNVYRVTLTKAHGTIARHIRKTMTAKEYAALRKYLEREGNLGEYWREGGLGDRS
jgi:energy-coupling factor transporter ATP-binding protein EcfA2